MDQPMIKPTDEKTDTASEEDAEEMNVSLAANDVAVDEEESNEFTLDEPLLRSRGFISSGEKAQRVALEMRGIKRRLLRRLGFSRRRLHERRGGKSILVTSTRPAEGKTFTAINLAISFVTEDGIGAVLVDADAPRPRVLHQLGVSSDRPGLLELLAGEGDHSLESCLLHETNHPLSILPVGHAAGPRTELFSGEEMQTLIREASKAYPDRLLIIDTPPVLAMPDAVILAPLVDEVVFVVEAHATSEAAVATAIDELLDVNENVSVILNRCKVPGEASHYYSYEEYYSRKGGGRD